MTTLTTTPGTPGSPGTAGATTAVATASSYADRPVPAPSGTELASPVDEGLCASIVHGRYTGALVIAAVPGADAAGGAMGRWLPGASS